jgi:hypothetical protein
VSKFVVVIIAILLFQIGCAQYTDTTDGEPQTSHDWPIDEAQSFTWFLSHHAEKIAHSDPLRKIIQIRVLDQIGLGSRQCGYHALRNFFFLAALAEAITKKDSALVNLLYTELHDVEKFRVFVDELAKIKGCAITHFHQSNPTPSEYNKLYQVAKTSFPSTLTIDDIIAYGVVTNGGNEFVYFKHASTDFVQKTNYFHDLLNSIKQDFNVELPLSDRLKELTKINLPAPHDEQLWALKNMEHGKPFPIYVNLQGDPGHGVAASVFRSTSDIKPIFLFADPWHDESFQSGWSQEAVDILYKLISDFDDAKNLGLLRKVALEFSRMDLLWHEHITKPDIKGSLTDILAVAAKNPSRRAQILGNLANAKKLFADAVKEFNLSSASLYQSIEKLIEKIQ